MKYSGKECVTSYVLGNDINQPKLKRKGKNIF
jgi:hypothetical protein